MSTTTAPATLGHWIGGRHAGGGAERFGDVPEAATGEGVARVPFATPAVVDRAVRAGTDAFATWGRASVSQRATILFAFRELVHAHREDLARIITREHGKALDDAAGEVQ